MRIRAIFALLLCSVLTACHSGAATGAPSQLVIAVPQEPPSLSGLLVEGPTSAMIVPLVYSYLLTMDDRGELVPDLASAVPTLQNGGISRDGLTVTYHLRRGVVWQDGAPLTARDVVFTAQQIVNPANNVYSRYGFDRIRSVTAPDPYTVRVQLNAPFSTVLCEFLAPCNNFGVLPQHLLRGRPSLNRLPFNSMPVGSGPFRVVTWARGDRIVLARNPRYFRGAPKLDEIVLKVIPDSNTVLSQLRTGEVNTYLFSDPQHAAEYASIAGARVSRAPFAAFGDLLFNLNASGVSDPQVRRAIVEALDIPRIARNATRGMQTPQDANQALFGTAFDPSVAPLRYDPAAAKRELSPRHLDLTLVYESGKAASASVAVQVQQQLHDAGVHLDLRSYTPDMFRAPASAGGPLWGGKFQLAFFEVFTTGDWDSSWYLGCKQRSPTGFNASQYCDAASERAMSAVLASYDPAAQRRFSAIAQRRVASLVPFVSLWSQQAIYVTPKVLLGFRPSPVSPYWNAWAWSLAPNP